MIDIVIQLCMVVSAGFGIYDCDYSINYVSFTELQDRYTEVNGSPYEGDGFIGGFFNPNTKQIFLYPYSTDENLRHEWKHAFCWNYFVFHKLHNHENCTGHFKIGVKNELAS